MSEKETPSASPGMLSPLNINIFSRHKKLTLCMSNCRNIEVVLLYPPEPVPSKSPPLNPSSSLNSDFQETQNRNQEVNIRRLSELQFSMSAAATAQEHDDADLSPTSNTSRDDTPLSTPQGVFRFLDLPLQLRLKIYALLLPARTHTIVTQIPHNGYFYNTSTIPLHSATSFYPFGTSAPKPKPHSNLTTYKVLNRNFRTDFPDPSIYPHLLLINRQIKLEAEPVLYASPNVEWDFGICLEAVSPFFSDRSTIARQCVRYIKVAREIRDDAGSQSVDYGWEKFCTYISSSLLNLRTVDLTIWSSTRSTAGFPSSGAEGEKEVERKWKEWEFIRELMGIEGLRRAEVTWWGCQGEEKERGQGFDSSLARRMVGDKVVRERMVMEGVVKEGRVVLAGGTDV
jgi:hypothetical protein